MDWRFCVICGGGGDLKCPANSKENNGLEIYSKFLQTVAEFQEYGSLPVSVKFTEEDDAEVLLKNKAKWHKSCHLKFAPSKLLRLVEKRKISFDPESDEQQRKSKRQRISGPSYQDSCIFCSEVSGVLHNCETMKLDHDLRRMATELQDSSLLARISGGDLIAIEAKYHFSCLSTFKNKHRSMKRAHSDLTISQEDKLIEAQVFDDLISYIEESIGSGIFIFKLSELYSMYVNQLKVSGIEKGVHKTRLKLKILDYFLGDCQEQFSDGKSIVLVFKQGMKSILKEAIDSRDFESEALAMVKLVKILRREIFDWKSFQFSGSFPPNCQSNSVPTTLKLFFSLLLHGSNHKKVESQASLTIAQLVYFNAKVNKSSSLKSRHNKDHEPPLPLFVGLSVHTHTRSKKIVNSLYRMGIGVSYDRVLEIENSLATAVCKRFEEDNLVCPPNLRKGLFTVGAFDNIDHNPTSTTAQGSFHGTGISIFQFPTQNYQGVVRDPIVIIKEPLSKKFSLPDEYVNVPAISCKTDRLSVPELAFACEGTDLLEAARASEEEWVHHSINLLTKENIMKGDYISWAAFHASLESDPPDPPAISALLPLFYEKAATLSMVKHGMDVQKSITTYLNPGQIPVTAFDQPLFALAKFVQWCWPETHGEQHYVVMFGGLHIEMALWNTLGDLLECSGWTTALCEAGIASSGTADSLHI